MSREIIDNKVYEYIDRMSADCDPTIRGYANYISTNSPRTVSLYVRTVKMFLSAVGKSAGELTFNDFSNFIAERKRDENGKEYTSSYRIILYTALKRYNEYLVVAGVLTTNHMANIAKPKQRDSQETILKREKGYLTPEELKMVLDGIRNDYKDSIRDMAIFQTFLNTGMRLSALVSLDVDDYDPHAHTLSVTDKGDKVRTFVLGKGACHALDEWIKEREMQITVDGNGYTTNAMFTIKKTTDWEDPTINEDHYGRISLQGMRHLVTRRCKVVPGKHLTPHKLRATYGTQLYDKTKDIYFVQKCMGHSNPKTTQIYIRGEGNCTEKASEIMDDLLGGM